MTKYPKATLSKRSGKTNYYVYLTVPQNLLPLLNGRRQIYKSAGSDDFEQARYRLRELEAELYLNLDQAELANHPLVQAWQQLEVAIEGHPTKTFDDLAPYFEWTPQTWFDPEERWSAEEDVRNRAGAVISATNGIEDTEEAMFLSSHQKRVEPFLDEFLKEFRKVSEEKYAPSKRIKPFSEVAEEWFASSLVFQI